MTAATAGISATFTAPPMRARSPASTIAGPTPTTPRWRARGTGIRRSAWPCSRGTCRAGLPPPPPPWAAPILDAGAGTGLVGEWLGIAGYPHVEALDISERMLAKAGEKGAYRALHRAVLGEPLPFADRSFAAIISAGVFTTGHVGAEALPELMRICRPGGAMVLTVKDTVWEGGFADAISELARAGRLRIAEETVPYVSMPGEPGTVPSRGLVLTIP
jgi:SAM-dependent methyltransferase